MSEQYIRTRTVGSWLMILFLLPGLQSCFVAKPYDRPEIEELDELYRNFDRRDTTTLANIPWQQLFPDPQLRTLIQEALDSSLILDSAYQSWRMAKANYLQGRSMYLPSIDALANVSSTKFSQNSASGRQFSSINEEDQNSSERNEQYELLATLSWEADIWGRIKSIERARRADLLRNEAAYRAVQTRLIALIASNYYRLLSLDAQLKVTNETIITREKSLETIIKLQESGQETALAVKQQESQIYTARILKINLLQRIALVEDSLSLLLSRPAGNIQRGALNARHIIIDGAIGIPSQLLRNRPDVMQAEFAFANAFHLTNEAEANFYPRLNLSAEAGFQSLTFSDWLSSASFYNSIMAGLTAPVFRQREIRTNYEIAQAQQEMALINFEQALLNAGREVSDALITYEATKQKIELRQQQLNTLSTAEEYAYKLLANGYANYLEVLRTTDEKLTAEIDLINMQYQNLNSLVRLYQALGGGWKSSEGMEE